MAPRKPEECKDMDAVREEIDRIDAELVDLIGERFAYVDRAWQLKQSPAEARVPWRIQQVIDRVRARAAEQGLPPELAEALWRQMIGWFIQYEEEKLRQQHGRRKVAASAPFPPCGEGRVLVIPAKGADPVTARRLPNCLAGLTWIVRSSRAMTHCVLKCRNERNRAISSRAPPASGRW